MAEQNPHRHGITNGDSLQLGNLTGGNVDLVCIYVYIYIYMCPFTL